MPLQILDTALQDGLTDDASDVYNVLRGTGDVTSISTVTDKIADINQSVQDIQVGTYIVWYVIRLLILTRVCRTYR